MMLMRKIGATKTFIEEHRKGVFIVCLLLLMFITSSAMRACSLANMRAQEEVAVEQQAQEVDSANEESADNDSILTDAQKREVGQYSSSLLDVSETLKLNKWIYEADDTYYLEFGDGTITEHSRNTNPSTKTFIIKTVTAEYLSETTQRQILAIEYDGRIELAYLESVANENGTIRTLESDFFAKTDHPYTLTTASTGDLTMDEMPEDLKILLGEHESEIEKSVQSWVLLNAPATTSIKLDHYAAIDTEAHTITLTYHLDNVTGTGVSVVYNFANNTVEAQGQSGR